MATDITAPSVARWRPYAQRALFGVPTDFVLAWIAHESAGRPDERTSLDERGVLQVHPDEATRIMSRAEFDSLILPVTAPGFSYDTHMRISARLVRMRQQDADRYMRELGLRFSGQDYWTYVKLIHGLPAVAYDGVKAFTATMGRRPASMREFADWVVSSGWTRPGWTPGVAQRVATNSLRIGAYARGGGGGVLTLAVAAFVVWGLYRLRRRSHA